MDSFFFRCARMRVVSLFFLVTISFHSYAQYMAAPGQTRSDSVRLERGRTLYGQGLWQDAVLELRRAQGESTDSQLKGEAQYWIVLAEIGAGEYVGALRDLSLLEGEYARGPWTPELPYHRGRANYYLGRYDEALIILKEYADSLAGTAADQRYSALYWVGECLYSMGQLDRARDVFALIIDEYPQSIKYEAASYRLSLITQKKIEKELLAIIRWSHEEALRTAEEYQRRERSYEQAIRAYQRRIAELETQLPLSRGSSDAGTERVAEIPYTPEPESPAVPESQAMPDPHRLEQLSRLLSLKGAALELVNAISAELRE